MEIYRVAETKQWSEKDFKLVDSLDLATDSRAQISKNIVRKINISKEAEVRHSLIAIQFSDEDILALYEGLITRWSNERAEHKKLKVENDGLKKKIDDLQFSRRCGNF